MQNQRQGSSLWELFSWTMGIITHSRQFKIFLYIAILFTPNTIGESGPSAQPTVARYGIKGWIEEIVVAQINQCKSLPSNPHHFINLLLIWSHFLSYILKNYQKLRKDDSVSFNITHYSLGI